MWAVLAAIVGFIGGVLLTRLTALLQRKNWQHQECMRAYAEMFATGEETLRWCSILVMHLDSLNALLGDLVLIQAQERNPDFQAESQKIADMDREFHSLHDAKFRSAMDQCWLLERNGNLRAKIEKFGQDYLDCKVGLRWRFSMLNDIRKAAIAKHLDENLHPDQLSTALKQLRKAVAAEHFHDKDETEKA